MKLIQILLLAIIVAPVTIHAQDTLYFDADGDEVKTMELCDHYTLIKPDPTNKNGRFEQTFTKSGVKKSEGYKLKIPDKYSPGKFFWTENGDYTKWYPSGKLYEKTYYSKGKYEGNLVLYWENGKKKRFDLYKDNELIEGNCFDSIGNKIAYFPYEVMPTYPGGDAALIRFLSTNIRYPYSAQQYGIQGKVVVGFVVDSIGNAVKTKLLKGVMRDLDEEALRVVKLLPKWKPGIQDGKAVNVKYSLPVSFKLY